MPELEHALRLDYLPEITNLRRSIDSLCGQLLCVDDFGRVQMIHETAKEFLLNTHEDDDFAINKARGNSRLAET